MDAVLRLRQAACFQSMELQRPEAMCGLESGTQSRLWSTRGDCAYRQEGAPFGLSLAGSEIARLKHSVQLGEFLRVSGKTRKQFRSPDCLAEREGFYCRHSCILL